MTRASGRPDGSRPSQTLPTVSAVVPVYNGEATLEELVGRLCSVLAGAASRFELVLVNDGSRDRSWEIISRLAEREPRIRPIDLMRNYGQHNALLAGIRAAACEVTVTLDDDLQNPPEEVPKLLGKLADGYDVVYGTPHRQQHGLWRDLASEVTKIALRTAMGADTARNVSAFRAFPTRLRGAFSDYRSPFVSLDVLLTWSTTRFASTTVRHEPRLHGTSNYTARKLLVHALNMMTGFSTLPLQLASLTGFAFTLFGAAVLALVIGRYLLEGASVPGFPFLASIVALFAGAQLFALGIIGEYLARMHFRMLGRPSYVIRSDPASAPD